MKTYLKSILSSILMTLAFSSYAAAPKYFENLSEKPGYEYVYVSPLMLKALGTTNLASSKTLAGDIGLNIPASTISHIEIISSPTMGQDDELWKIIRNIKNDKKLSTLTTKKEGSYRYDVLAKPDGSNLNNLMIVTQEGGYFVNVVYIEGKIPLDNIKNSIIDK